jgi:predicted nucleic-acid-binding protein
LILADTNILLRLLWQDDTAQLRSIEQYLAKAKHARRRIQIHTLTIAEIVWMLQQKRWSRVAIVDALLEFCASDQFEVIDVQTVKAALALYLEGKTSFVDAFQAAYVTEHQMGVLSFDRDYDGLGVRRVEL